MVVRAAEDGEPDAAWKTAHSGLQEMEIVELPVHEEAEEPLVQRSAAVDEYWKKFSSDYYYNLLTDGEKLIWDRLEESCLNLIQGNYWMDSADAECLDLGMEEKRARR